MPNETIGDWTIQQLVRFLDVRLRESPPSKIPALTCDTLDITTKVRFFDQLQFNLNQTTVGVAGGASALPATPTGYVRILDYAGNEKLIPYYNMP